MPQLQLVEPKVILVDKNHDADEVVRNVQQQNFGSKNNIANLVENIMAQNGCLISWHSKKQHGVALSTTKDEYVAAGSCLSQILWIKQQLLDYDLKLSCVPIKCDNTSDINLTKNPVLHSRTKHIKNRHHFLRDHVEKKDVTFEYIDTKSQLADIFTKPLPIRVFSQNLYGTRYLIYLLI